MKKISLIIFAVMAMAFIACDEVSNDKRLTYIEPPEAARAILIEDFTGQYCVNCPRATEEIERLIEQYGDTVIIAVAIHSGPFSKDKTAGTSPLYTEVGDQYFSNWKLSAQPVGLVDRLFGMPLNYTDWGGAVNYELTDSINSKAVVSIIVNTAYDFDTELGYADVQTIGMDSKPVSGKLQVWLVEDSIDSFQLMPNGSREEHYNHMHVFRASINDPWGDDLTVSHGEVVSKKYEFALDPAWVFENCSLVVFLYDEDGVKQVTKKKLMDY